MKLLIWRPWFQKTSFPKPYMSVQKWTGHCNQSFTLGKILVQTQLRSSCPSKKVRERATHSDNSTWWQLSFHWKHWKLFFVALRLTHTSDKSNSLKSWENIFAFKVSEITIKQKQVLCSWTCQMPLVAILDSILVFVLGFVCVCVFCFYWKKISL